jgi:hypothetical protein
VLEHISPNIVHKPKEKKKGSTGGGMKVSLMLLGDG